MRYLALETERMSLAEQMQASGHPSGHRVADLLRSAGIFSTIHGE